MASKREIALQAVVDALSVAGPIESTVKPASLTVHRMRTRPLNQEQLPAMVVWWSGDDAPQYDVTRKADRKARIWVECRAKQSGASPDAALDPMLVWAVKAVMVDITLGGASVDIDEGRSVVDLNEQEEGFCAAAVEFIVDYQSAFNDLEAL